MFKKLGPSRPEENSQRAFGKVTILLLSCPVGEFGKKETTGCSITLVQAAPLVSWIMEEFRVWVVARFRQLSDFIQ
jgi:hypothetical protein